MERECLKAGCFSCCLIESRLEMVGEMVSPAAGTSKKENGLRTMRQVGRITMKFNGIGDLRILYFIRNILIVLLFRRIMK